MSRVIPWHLRAVPQPEPPALPNARLRMLARQIQTCRAFLTHPAFEHGNGFHEQLESRLSRIMQDLVRVEGETAKIRGLTEREERQLHYAEQARRCAEEAFTDYRRDPHSCGREVAARIALKDAAYALRSLVFVAGCTAGRDA
jgi:hypothetical protein